MKRISILSAILLMCSSTIICGNFWDHFSKSGVDFLSEIHDGQVCDPVLSAEDIILSQHHYEVFRERVEAIKSAFVPVVCAASLSWFLMENPNAVLLFGMVSIGFRDKLTLYKTRLEQALSPPPEVAVLNDLMLDFRLREQDFPLHHKTAFREMFARAKKAVFTTNSSNKDDLIERARLILRVPTHTRPIEHRDGAARIKASMEETYDATLVENLCIATNALIRAFDYQGSVAMTKACMCFIGEPGIGKSTTADLIGRSCGLPFMKIEINEVTADSLSAGMTGSTGTEKHCGLIAKHLIESGQTNVLFFIDEIGDVDDIEQAGKIRTVLKQLLDNKPLFYDRTLQMHIPVGHIWIILATNKFLKDETKALGDRVEFFEFSPPTPAARVIIAKKYLRDSLNTYNYPKDLSKSEEFLRLLADDGSSNSKSVRRLEKQIANIVKRAMAIDDGVIQPE